MDERSKRIEIAEQIAAQFGMRFADMKKKTNIVRFINARNMAYHILHYDYGVSLNSLCEMFERTNREVCYRLADSKERIEKDAAFKKRHDSIISKLCIGE